MTRELSQKDLEEIEKYHAQNLSAMGISVMTDIPREAVVRGAKQLGLAFNQQGTAKAARVRADEAFERRAILMKMQLDEALELQKRMFTPCTVGQFGGRDNTWNEVTLDEPNYQDKLRIQQTINSALSNVMKLMEADAASNRTTVNLILATAEKLGLSGVDGA